MTALCSALALASCARFVSVPLEPHETAAAFAARSLTGAPLANFARRAVRSSTWPPAVWDREALTVAALYFHPDLELARYEWKAADAATITAGERPNPSAGLHPGRSLNPASGTSPWLAVFDVDVPIETAGKRGYRLDVARSEADAARMRVAEAAWTVCGGVRDALLHLQAASRREALLGEQAGIHKTLVKLLEQRLAAGAIEAVELRKARVALTTADLTLETTVRDREVARSELAKALGVPLSALEAVDVAATLPSLPSRFIQMTPEQLRDEAVTSRPDVRAALADYAARQAALQLEIAKQYPDVHLGTGYEYDQGDHKWSLGLSLDLPLLNRNEGPIAEAEAARAESRARFLQLQANVFAAVDEAVTSRRAAERRLAYAERLEASERAALRATRASLAAGAVDRLELVNAEIEERDARLAKLDAELALRESYASYEDALERPLLDGMSAAILASPESAEITK